MRSCNIVCVGHFRIGIPLGMLNLYCLSPVSLHWVANANMVSGGMRGEGEVYKGWNSRLAQWGAIIPTVQRAPGHLEYICIIMKTNDLCDILSIYYLMNTSALI